MTSAGPDPRKNFSHFNAGGKECLLVNSGLQRKACHSLLKETNNLVCSCNTCVVVCLNGLRTHLLFCEDHTLAIFVTNQCLNLLNVLGCNVRKVAEIRPRGEHFQKFSFMNHL